MIRQLVIALALLCSTAPLASAVAAPTTVEATDPECPEAPPSPGGYTGEDPCPTPQTPPLPRPAH